MVTLLDQFLFMALPYILLVLFFGIQAYRWVVNRFGWSARSSEIFEKQMLGVTAIPFHYALIFLLVAHILGVISGNIFTRELLQVFYSLATIAGAVLVYAIAVSLARRIIVKEVRAMSTAEDYIILVFLLVIPSIGLYQYLVAGVFGIFPGVSLWIQGVFTMSPRVEIMAALPLLNKLHMTLVMIFLCYWPFTKLVHMVTFPITYTYRRYQPMRMHRKVIP